MKGIPTRIPRQAQRPTADRRPQTHHPL